MIIPYIKQPTGVLNTAQFGGGVLEVCFVCLSFDFLLVLGFLESTDFFQSFR